jgi:sirohydrochlorin cobaltochelatase
LPKRFAFTVGSSRFTDFSMKSALILLAHGARDAEWSLPFRSIQHKVAARLPGITVELAFLEISAPKLQETFDKLVATGHARVTVAPMLMAQGGHLKRDIPRLIESCRSRHPTVDLRVLQALGDTEAVLDAIAGWLVNTLQS